MKHVKLFEHFINEAASSINEASDSSIKPNSKLKNATGYPYAMFYFSTGIHWKGSRLYASSDSIMVNFEDTGHVSLIKLLADQDRERRNAGSLSTSSISKGKNLFKKVLGHNIVYSMDGADCTFRLSSTPSVDLSDGKKEWFSVFVGSGPFKKTEAIEMENYI